MRLTVLGSSASWPNPGEACAGHLVDAPAGRILLDCGNGVLSRLLALGGDPPAAIVCSHVHPDHVGDLTSLLFGLIWGPLDWPATTLWLPPGGRVVLGDVLDAFGFGSGLLDRTTMPVREYRTAAPLEVAGATLSFARTQHSPHSYLIRVEADGRSLVYTGDTAPVEAVHTHARGCHLLLCEATLAEPESTDLAGRVHLTAREAGLIAAEARAGRLVLTHLAADRRAAALADARDAFAATDLALPGASFEV